MLVLSRKRDQSIMIGGDIRITVVDVKGDTVQLGIDAPRSIAIFREEIWVSIQAANEEAARKAEDSLDGIGRVKPPGDSS